jgi:hypothetical protein
VFQQQIAGRTLLERLAAAYEVPPVDPQTGIVFTTVERRAVGLRWPRGAPCAKPWALVRGSPSARFTIEVSFHQGRKHLPMVRLKRAA